MFCYQSFFSKTTLLENSEAYSTNINLRETLDTIKNLFDQTLSNFVFVGFEKP